MNIESLHIGMKLRHPQYGEGQVKSLNEHTADILFSAGVRTIEPRIAELQLAEPHASVTSLEIPLEQLIKQTAQSVVDAIGFEKPNAVVESLGYRWHGGRMVLHPTDPTLQTKEVPLEVFFHKIVMMRNNLRNLEQKVNSHEKMTDAEKYDLQQYISRCYGSMTTFNILFKSKEDQFGS